MRTRLRTRIRHQTRAQYQQPRRTRRDPNIPKPPERVDFKTGVGKDATDFLSAVGMGTAKGDQLSLSFVKAIGLPVTFPADKAKGYSVDAATQRLKQLGNSTGFGPPLSSKQMGDVAIFNGSLVGKPGMYSLRMAQDGGMWKVDWLSLTTVVPPTPSVFTTLAGPTTDAEALLRLFAATAIFEAICDKDAMPALDRTAVIAAGLTPELRKAWADPFDGDKAEGYDYSRTKLAMKVAEIGGNAVSVSYSLQGDAFKAEVTKTGGAKAAYLVKLAKGTTPGQWLIESITPQ